MRGLFLLGSLLLLVFLLWPIVRRLLPPPARRPRAIQDELVKDPGCPPYHLLSLPAWPGAGPGGGSWRLRGSGRGASSWSSGAAAASSTAMWPRWSVKADG